MRSGNLTTIYICSLLGLDILQLLCLSQYLVDDSIIPQKSPVWVSGRNIKTLKNREYEEAKIYKKTDKDQEN